MKKIISSVEVLSQSEIEQIHETAVRVLSEIGASVPNTRVLELCKKNGAIIDKNSMTMKIPRDVIDSLINETKKQNFVNYDQSTDGVSEMSAEISTQIFLYDYKTQTRRNGLKDDIMKGIALLNKLESFKHANAVVLPSDVPHAIADIYTFYLLLSYSAKEGITYVLSADSAPYIIDMLKLMGRPCNYFLETVSPLGFRKESLDIALVFAEKGGTLSPGPMVMAGATGPMSIAGTMVQSTAEILLSLFVNHALTGKLGKLFCNSCHTMDPKTMLCSFGSPNQALFAVASAQMGRFYGLIPSSNSGLSDALMPDFQCGMEKASSMLIAMLSGCASVGCMGIAGADQGISFEQIVIDNEMFRILNYIMRGFEVTDYSLGFEAIQEAGIGGNFLGLESTVDFLRSDYIQSGIFLREAFSPTPQRELLDRAADYVERVTAGYREMTPISAQKHEELSRILSEAEKRLVN